MVNASDFRKGVTFEKDGQPCLIVDFQHVKPGKGAAFVRTKYKNLKTGAIREEAFNPSDKFPKAHELYFKALAVDPCDKENFKAVIIRIPSFIPSPEFTLALQGGDSQTMDYKGAILADTCSADKVLFEVYFIDEDETA